MATESTTWWYCLNNNVSLISYTKEELNGLLDNNTITRDTLVQQDGDSSGTWKHLREVEALNRPLPPGSSTRPAPPVSMRGPLTPQTPKTKTAKALFKEGLIYSDKKSRNIKLSDMIFNAGMSNQGILR